MNISSEGITFLKRVEGYASVMYKDVAGLATIGVGHLLTKSELLSGKILINGNYRKWRDGLSDNDIEELLKADVGWAERDVDRLVTVQLAQFQFDALVSFCFNVGTQAFRDSTLLKKLNNREYDEVPAQLRRWVHAGGRVVRGLQNRREWEIKLWKGEGA